jgi:UDP-N-acetylmuramoyl-L-alanyl-D-glutamate--2,6-diaminopimelate ligase
LNPLKFKKILSYNKKKADPLFLSASYNCDNLSLALNLINLIQKVNFNEDFSFLTAPPGRYEAFNHKDQLVIVDYAHTPDALENICRQMKKDFPEKKLVLVFGCGGDRDRKKRPIMGKIATELCSKVYLTSDNPRSENPAVIIDEILKGTDGKKIHIQVDRKIAIIDAFKNLKPNEILLIAGKGHETYQEIMGKKWPFSDKEVVQGIL